ncbi:MAG TPA: tetratricopeptide repeat protein, partial [Candidatus Obscuribacter sp.]|nr:tetratricopeptide repeat protein [Candidatus Obscuribacter sp.]
EHAVEQPASIAGLVLDGRTVRIIGPHSIIMTDKGNGRQSILMDGQTFTDKAMAKLDTGKLSDAEQLFVLALRADPDSDAFGLLGECWYLQGNIENALQASSMALEVNKENAHAAAIQRLCLNSLKYPEKLGTDNAPLLKVAIAPDSSEKPMTVAISLLALGKLKEAKLSFSKILKKYPGSFRASTFKSKCRDEN